MSLGTKVCVITGGSSGIGLAAAEAWAGEGATVVLIARGAERLKAAAERVRAAGGEVHHLVADVSSEGDVARVADFLAAGLGRVDLLFNNAGVGHDHLPLHELPAAEFDRVLATNLRGAYLMTKALLPLLRMRPGAQVLNTTSGLKAAAGWGAYSISKSALDALTRVQAAELRPYAIRVNAFNPGWVRTALAPDAPDPVDKVVPRLLDLARQDGDGPTGEEIRA